MVPYNCKVWAFPLERISFDWVAERVSVPDLKKVLENLILARDDPPWGPNARFLFPLQGGTGAIYRHIALKFREKIVTGRTAVSVSYGEKRVRFEDGEEDT